MTNNYDDDEYYLPLEDQRAFGAGITRTRVKFVPAAENVSTTETINATDQKSALSTSVGDTYLSIVLKKREGKEATALVNQTTDKQSAHSSPQPSTITKSIQEDTTTAESTSICPICSTEIHSTATHTHESSIPHQFSLPHSHPPSHLDRTRPGLKYLESYGWNPDARQGLGTSGTGIREPIKTKVKNDTVGLGVKVKKGAAVGVEKKKEEKLDAGRVRKMEGRKKKEEERLRGILFGRDEEIERVLNGGGKMEGLR